MYVAFIFFLWAPLADNNKKRLRSTEPVRSTRRFRVFLGMREGVRGELYELENERKHGSIADGI
jgi:hypothetical protein